MKVLVVGNYVEDQQRSMLGFAQVLKTGLENKDVQVRLIAPRAIFGRLFSTRPMNSGLRKWLGYIDKFIVFPASLRRAAAWADMVHVCDHGNSMYVKHLLHKPHLVTCHDLLAVQAARGEFPGWETGESGQKFQQLIIQGLEQAQFIVCVSQHTERELHRIAPTTTQKTKSIYNGFYHLYSVIPVEQSQVLLEPFGLANQSYLLHVGGNQPYKNRLRVLEIFQALQQNHPRHELKLVMAGKPWTEAMRAFVASHKLQEQALELVDLKHEELRALYSCAKALVFPSLAEGFGLPIIEAQACHCPVFTTGRPPMNEVGGAGAFYFDPDDVLASAKTIHDNLDNAASTVKAGQENIERFSTEKMLNGYIEIYKQILSGSAGVGAS